MKRLLVWIVGPVAVTAHREHPGARGKTACGLWTDSPPERPTGGFWIDWRHLNPSTMRLCERCWGSLARRVIRDAAFEALPACERVP